MKKSLLALAVLGAFAGVASAQSSVTCYGIVDLSVNDIKNGNAHTQSMQSNQLNSNRLGFRGIEDLGGGLKAGFWLEAAMSNENGSVGGGNGIPAPSNGSSIFNRRSTVSLYSPWGEIRAGRDYDATLWNLVYDDVNGGNGLGQGFSLIPVLGSGNQALLRVNGTVEYLLPPTIGGLYGQAQVSAPTNNASNGNPGRPVRNTTVAGSVTPPVPSMSTRPMAKRSSLRSTTIPWETRSRSGTPAVRGTSVSSSCMACTTKSSSRASRLTPTNSACRCHSAWASSAPSMGMWIRREARGAVQPQSERRQACTGSSMCTTYRSALLCTRPSVRSRTRAERRCRC